MRALRPAENCPPGSSCSCPANTECENLTFLRSGKWNQEALINSFNPRLNPFKPRGCLTAQHVIRSSHYACLQIYWHYESYI